MSNRGSHVRATERRDFNSAVTAAAALVVGIADSVAVGVLTGRVSAAVMSLAALACGGIGVGVLLARDPNKGMFDVDEEKVGGDV